MGSQFKWWPYKFLESAEKSLSGRPQTIKEEVQALEEV